MKTGILGLKTEKGAQREEHRKKPSKTSLAQAEQILLVHTGHDAKHHGPERRKETQHEVHCQQQYQPCHTTAAVLLDHTGHNAKHRGPDDARREHNARYIVTSKTSTASEPLSLSTTSAARKKRGTRRPPLPPFLPLPLWKRGSVIQESLGPPLRLRSSSSLCRALSSSFRSQRTVVLSVPSRPASDGTERRGAPASGHRGAADNPCGSETSSRGSGRVPGGRVFGPPWGVVRLAPCLVAVFWLRRAPFCCALWCVAAARAAAIDCCSCRHHERSRRCLRR